MARSFINGAVANGQDHLYWPTVPSSVNNIRPLSVSVWCNIINTSTHADHNVPFCKIGSTFNAGQGEFCLSLIHESTNPFVGVDTFEFHAPAWSTGRPSWGCAAASMGAWHHYGVTYAYSATTDTPLFYVDGVAQTAQLIAGTGATGTLIADTFKIEVGNGAWATQDWWINGDVGPCAYWGAILSPGEMQALARGVSPLRVRPGSLSFYCSVEGTGTDVDWGPNQIGSATLVGSPRSTTNPPLLPEEIFSDT